MLDTKFYSKTFFPSKIGSSKPHSVWIFKFGEVSDDIFSPSLCIKYLMLCPITIMYSAEYVEQSPRIKKLPCKRSMFMDSWWPEIQIMILMRYGYSQKIVCVCELDKRHKFWFSVPLVINCCFIFGWNLLCSWYEFHCQTWHLMQRCV